MIKKENTLFLLGGHDLEMLTIKKLLEEKGFTVIDHELSWGAKLSSYTEVLKEHQDKTIYGVELIEDIAIPKNYHAIDHHNEQVDKASSLFQVLECLELKPTREHKLISANDVGHIEAMKCLGATAEEIKSIRQQERTIQGITAKDELQAQKESEAVVEKNGISIIETTLDAFSPIVDNYEKRPLLVYSQKSFTYYGDIAFLKEKYKKQIENKEAYHSRGYFGFDTAYVGLVTPNILVKEIVEVKQKNIISYHNFMFPFRFDKIVESFEDRHEFYKKHSFDKRVKIDESFKNSLEKNKWKYEPFEVKNNLDYNEIVYFHDFVKDTLFNTAKVFDEGATSYYFEKKLNNEATFELKVKGKEPYVLKLEGVNLRLFDTGVGILSFEVENYDYYQIEDILKINDYGRRVYPQFLGANFSTEDTKKSFLPESITVNGIEERFCDLYKEIKLAKYIIEILGDSFSTDTSNEDKYFLQPIIDDRMFVLSWYGNDAFVTCTKENIENDNWYKYVFVDGNDITVQDTSMHKELIEKATYKRWNKYGTFFGITRYSFVCLSQNSGFTRDDLPLPHMKTMYFQMVSLLLAQRATLLRFSDEITAISDVKGGENPSSENISVLYKNYLRFVNKLYFKEVTAQDQGIELYDKAIDILNIKRDVEDLREEIGTLNGYAFLEQEREEKKEMTKLSKLGTYLIPPTLVAGFFGMNVFGKESLNVESTGWLASVILLTVVSPFIVNFFINEKKKTDKGKK
ncbi:MAG: Unknown protein [uncultured Sulfurovum sp.]|uniref:Uncharacterized protein n=1 Tax=uncultured Sulfurovum sp. TaxID=269237 RepID=A0A6S6SYA5_9BACT|nr:MAG: Unknown protein [uncultured Sulfurovum sp.]